MRCPVTLLTIGASMIRVCERCFGALVKARARLQLEGLDVVDIL